jgi:hypothetical protein
MKANGNFPGTNSLAPCFKTERTQDGAIENRAE